MNLELGHRRAKMHHDSVKIAVDTNDALGAQESDLILLHAETDYPLLYK